MTKEKDMVVLAMDSPTFAEDFLKEIGPGPHEFVTPQFHRTDGLTVSAPNLTAGEWQSLGKLPLERIQQLGCQKWDSNEKGTHWLFPGQWYPHIPAGLQVLVINGETETFQPGVTDDDIRFGALAYGFITLSEEL